MPPTSAIAEARHEGVERTLRAIEAWSKGVRRIG